MTASAPRATISRGEIRAHCEMIHCLAAPLAAQSKLVVASFGENPDQAYPKTGKPGLRLPQRILHFGIGDVDGTVRAIAQLSAAPHRNVYMSLAVVRPDLPAGKKGSEHDCLACLAIVADFDDPDAAQWPERVPVPPNYALETSEGRYQAFFLLDRPEPVAAIKPVAERLKTFARCDHGTSDASHVWRIPGTLNWPNAKKIAEGRSPEPQLVRAVMPWNGGLTTLAELAEALPEADHPGKGAPAAQQPEGGGADVSVELLVRQLPLKLRKRITEPCRGDRSKALFGVVKMLGERGFSAALIEHVIRAYPKGIGAKHADRADLAQDIARILSKPSQDPAPSTWRAELLYGEGATPRSNLANAIAALRLAPEWRHILGFDLFSQKIVARGKTPWMSAASEDAKAWTDVDDIRTADWLQHQGIFVSPLTAGQATQTVAHDYEFHPVKDYLASLTWDGSPRLDTWLADHFGITPDPKMPDENDHDVAIRHKSQQTYINAVGAKFMISCVARIMQPGCKVDCALIVEGSQGKHKSTAIKTLLPNPAWFTDEIGELGSKDAAMQLTGRWIIELSELESITRADVSRVKAFLSRSTDRFRPPYGRHIVSLPQQCGFIGTVNKNEYLRDETGARRFWTVKSRTTINLTALARDRDQLWAEALERYNKGEPWWLESVELETLAAKEQAARRVQDPWEKPIRHWITGRTHTSCEEILGDVLHLPIDRQDQRAANRVAAGAVATCVGICLARSPVG